ncbi:putative reverse transcriptase domain-containing protein [Tanacetum coccineum]
MCLRMFPEESDEVEKCNNFKKVGHLARDCRSPAAAANNQRAPMANQRVVTCFECGVQRHYKKDFPKLKNNNRGNQAGNGGAIARAYAVGNAGKTQMPMYSLIDIVLTALDHDYDVELADEKIIEYHAVIVCDEKIIRIPFGNEILIVCGDGSNNGHESRYDVDKTEGEAIERNGNILASRFLLKYFRRIAGYYTNRQVEFHNPFDNWTVVPLALRRPYRLAPSRCKEFSNNCRELSAKDL